MSLQVWLPLNGALENQGLSNLNFSITDNIVVNDNGKIGKCYYNENPTFKIGQIISDNSINLGINQSMFCWVKFNTLCSASSLTGLVSQHNPADQTNMGLNIRRVSETTGYLTISTGTGSSRTYNTYYGTILLEANIWYHVGYTYDGTNIKLYVNGKLDKTQSFINQLCTNEKIVLFAWDARGTNANYRLNGYLNDVRIYDHCLSAKEVEEISKGLISHFKLNNNGYSNLLTSTISRTVTVPEDATNAYTSYWYFDTNIKNNNLFIENTFYTVLYDYSVNNLSELSTSAYLYSQLNTTRCSPVKSQTQFRTENTGHVIETFAVDANQADYASSFRFRIRLQSANPGDSITISNLRIYLGTQEEIIHIIDSSGYKKTGVAQLGLGMTTIAPSPKYMQAIMFDGRDWIDQIYPRNFPIDVILTEYSLSYWLYLSETAEQNQYIIANPICQNYIRASSSSYPNRLFVYWLRYIDDSTKSNNSWASINITSYLNQWIHICIVFDGDMHLYVNGELNSTSERGGFIKTVNRGQSIGYNTKTLQISDVREYVTALTAKQVKELYNTSMSIDNNGNIYTRELVE